MAVIEAARPGPVEEPIRPARTALLVARILMLLLALVAILQGLSLLASQPSVGTDAVECRPAVTAVVGGGTTEARDWYNFLLRPERVDNAWQYANSRCVREVRETFVSGTMLVIAGVALILARRRLPGRVRDLRAEPVEPSARKRRTIPRWLFVAAAVETVLAVALIVTVQSTPTPLLAFSDPARTIPSPLPQSFVGVRAELARLGFRETRLSPYTQNFSDIAPDAPTTLLARLEGPNGPALLYYAQLRAGDAPAATAAAIAFTHGGFQRVETNADGFYTPAASSHEVVGWVRNGRDLFVLQNWDRPPSTTAETLRLLHRLATA